jgi:hypothetical protein
MAEPTPSSRSNIVSARALAGLTLAFVAIGVIVRVVRFASVPPIWGDEAFLASSLIDRGFLDLLRPLDYHQVAPVLFLWASKLAVDGFGFHETALRLVPAIAGVASVPLFALLASRVARGPSRLAAIAIAVVSFYPVRHSGEFKPYAVDLAVSLLLMNLAAWWLNHRDRVAPLAWLAIVSLVAIGLSYPSLFVTGGIALALAPLAVRGPARARVAWAVFAATVAVSFGAWYALAIEGQAQGAGAATWRYWAGAFPPPQIWKLPLWLIEVHTSHAMAVPVGGASGASALTTVLVLVGARGLYRREIADVASDQSRAVLAVLLAPLGLGLAAAFLGRYPYGGSARTMQYAAGSIALLAGLGAVAALGRIRNADRRRRLFGYGVAALALLGTYEVASDLVRPYKIVQDERARAFARRFWVEQADAGATVACAHDDMGFTIDPRHWSLGRTAVYRCNRAIYGSRARSNRPLSIDPGRPLRCVVYNEKADDPALAAWVDQMRRRYDLLRVRQYAPVPGVMLAGNVYEDRYIVYEFATGPERVAGANPGSSTRK